MSRSRRRQAEKKSGSAPPGLLTSPGGPPRPDGRGGNDADQPPSNLGEARLDAPVGREDGRSLPGPAAGPAVAAPLSAWLTRTRAAWISAVHWLSFSIAVLVGMALVGLAVRAAVRLELRSDTFQYHLAFAAIRGGLDVPYEPTGVWGRFFQGFPPLPHLVQGILWRVTGSVNATGTVNYLAFCLFLAYGHLALRAPCWLVGAVALTAPLVLIHTTTSYVDLFANSFLAVGTASVASLYLEERYGSLRLWIGGLAGLAAAAWSKYQVVPLVAVFLGVYAVFLWHPQVRRLESRRTVYAIVALGIIVAAAPYAKNLIFYGNPFWPIRVPIIGNAIAFADDPRWSAIIERPPPLREPSQPEMFVHSLFEINHPTSYPHRPRWIIDQGNAWVAYRAGGFWNVAVVGFLGLIALFLWLRGGRKARVLGAGLLGTLVLVAVLPQSHELRYYMFLPLTWAALLGILFPEVRARYPAVAAGALALVVGLFLYSGWLNDVHYRIERIGYREAASFYWADRWWPQLQPGVTYCARDMDPIGILLTGPTMREFRVTDRRGNEPCPAGSVELRKPG